MRRQDLQLRVPVQDAAEDQVGQGHRVFRRLGDGVGEVEAVQPLIQRAAERVQEHQRAEFLGPAPERFQPRVRKFDGAAFRVAGSGGERADLHAEQPALQHRVLQGFHHQGGVLERDQAQAVEPVRRAVHELPDRLVGLLRQLQGQLFGGEVVEVRRRRRDQLHVHALGVHVRQPAVQVRQLRPALLDHPARGGHGFRSVAPDLQGLLGAEALGIGFGHELLQGGKQDVGVDVHGGGLPAGSVLMRVP